MVFPCPGTATDWTVVRVVVRERTEGAGEEKVLLMPPSVLAAVALVPALDPAASLIAVSAVVESVGGLETAFLPKEWCSSGDACSDSLLSEGRLMRDADSDRGVEKDRLPLTAGAGRPDSG